MKIPEDIREFETQASQTPGIGVTYHFNPSGDTITRVIVTHNEDRKFMIWITPDETNGLWDVDSLVAKGKGKDFVIGGVVKNVLGSTFDKCASWALSKIATSYKKEVLTN